MKSGASCPLKSDVQTSDGGVTGHGVVKSGESVD